MSYSFSNYQFINIFIYYTFPCYQCTNRMVPNKAFCQFPPSPMPLKCEAIHSFLCFQSIRDPIGMDLTCLGRFWPIGDSIFQSTIGKVEMESLGGQPLEEREGESGETKSGDINKKDPYWDPHNLNPGFFSPILPYPCSHSPRVGSEFRCKCNNVKYHTDHCTYKTHIYALQGASLTPTWNET